MHERQERHAANDLLAFKAMPEVANALRREKEGIVKAWIEAADALLPALDEMTTKQVRDTIPVALDYLASALESARRFESEELAEITKVHGVTRYHQSYDVKSLIVEYRLLRRICKERVAIAMGGMNTEQMLALDMGIDLFIQQGVVAFVDHQREQIERANAVEGRFLAYMSHDLRNHLNHATLMLEVQAQKMRGRKEFSEDVHDLEAVQRSIFQTIGGMDQLLEAERLRRDTFHPRRERFDLSATACEVIGRFQREAGEKGVGLACEVPAGFEVSTDRDVVALVLQNLVGNAVKFSTKGTVRISGKREGGPEDGWSIGVSDEGPGISAGDRERIFKAFTRGETYGQRGVGLGLTIASEGAKRLGGELQVESEVGVGSVFRLAVPGLVG